MNNAADYFVTLQQRINSMTPEQLAAMTKKLACMSGAYDVDGGPRVARAIIYTSHTPNQRRTTPAKK